MMKNQTHYSNQQVIHSQNQEILSYFYKSGALKAQGPFIDEKFEGTWSFYKKSGQLFQIGEFYLNQKHGRWIRYDTNGLVEMDEIFDCGKKIKKASLTIEQYIHAAEPSFQPLLLRLYQIIKQAAPFALETISYQMPTFVLSGNLVHFAYQSQHIGFYPGPSGVQIFLKHSSSYLTSKGTIKFNPNQPLPHDIIELVVKARVKENLQHLKK